MLPQTQCTRCGYPDCRGYAQAIAAGEADINHCPPGGSEGIVRLAALTGQALRCRWTPIAAPKARVALALIDESWLHRLHAVHQGLPGRLHRRRGQAHAHRDRVAVHRLRTVPAGLPGRLHRARGRDAGPQRLGGLVPRSQAEARERYRMGQARRERERLERTDRLEAHRTLPVTEDGPAATSGSEGRRAAIEAARLRARALRDAS